MSEKAVRFRSSIPDAILREYFGEKIMAVQRRALMSVVTVSSDENALELERRFAAWFEEREKVEQQRREVEQTRQYEMRQREMIGKGPEWIGWLPEKDRNPNPFTCMVLWGFSYLARQRSIRV
jgi:hypothetical protein